MDTVHGHHSQEVSKFGLQTNGTQQKKKPLNLGRHNLFKIYPHFNNHFQLQQKNKYTCTKKTRYVIFLIKVRLQVRLKKKVKLYLVVHF